jgi:replicative superfamily II helicase
LLKAILELHILGMCSSVAEVMEFVKCTLWYYSSGEAGRTEVIADAMTCLLFLIRTRLLNASSEELTLDCKTTLSRFGRAAYDGGLNPDEAIVYYEDFLNAHDGLNLQTNLHVIYLLTSFDHHIYPDFKRMWVEYEKSTIHQGQGSIFADIIKAVQIDIPSLFKWSHSPPSKDVVEKSSGIARLLNLRASGAQVKIKNNLSDVEWKSLSRCKRLFAASLLDGVIEGQPKAMLCSTFHIEEKAVDDLFQHTLMLSNKLRRFCGEMGWSALEKIITNFQKSLDISVSPDLKELMQIPTITTKVARVLVDHGWRSVKALQEASVETIVSTLQLALTFQPNDIDEMDSDEVVSAQEDWLPKQRRNRDVELRTRMLVWVQRLINTARCA